MDRQKLQDQIETLMYAVATKDVIPMLQHIWFHDGKVTTHNDQIAVEIDEDYGFTGTVEGKKLSSLIKSIQLGEVEVNPNESEDYLEVNYGNNRSRLPLGEYDPEFFQFPDLSDATTLEVENEFFDGLKECMRAVPIKFTRPAMDGITIKAGENIGIYATNNELISCYEYSPKKKTSRAEVIVPLSFVRSAIAFNKKENASNPKLHLGEDYAVLEFPGLCRLFTKVINAKPLDFESMVEQQLEEAAEEFYTVPEGFRGALNRALIVAGEQAECKIHFEESKITVEAFQQGSAADVQETFNIPGKQENLSVEVNPRLVLRGAEICEKMYAVERCLIFVTDKSKHLVANL